MRKIIIERFAFAVIALSVTTPRLALADGPGQASPKLEDEAQARRSYEAGLLHYNLAEYTEAIENFRQAYVLSPAPELLFNLAQSYRLKGPGNCATALQFYRNYLRADPKSTRHASVERAITDMESCADKEATSTPAPAPAPRAEAPRNQPPAVEGTPPPSSRSSVPVVITTGGGVLAATGAGLFIWAKLRYAAIEDSGCAPACDPSRVSGPKTGEMVGGILLGVGAAAVLTGVTLWLVGGSTTAKAAWLAPSIAGASTGLRF